MTVPHTETIWGLRFCKEDDLENEWVQELDPEIIKELLALYREKYSSDIKNKIENYKLDDWTLYDEEKDQVYEIHYYDIVQLAEIFGFSVACSEGGYDMVVGTKFEPCKKVQKALKLFGKLIKLKDKIYATDHEIYTYDFIYEDDPMLPEEKYGCPKCNYELYVEELNKVEDN